MREFPQEFVAPMISAAALMLVLTWLVFTHAAKRFAPSLLVAGILLAWLGAVLLLSRNGFFLKLSLWPVPNIGLLFLPIIVGVSALRQSPAFQGAVDHMFQPWLIGVQTMRVMGATFLTLYARGLMPAEFAIPSGVGDIVVGATAPFVALFLFFNRPFGRSVAIFWNIIGFFELSLAIVLGFFTSPTSYQLLALDNPNNLLFVFPLALVPVFAVPLSLLLHIFSLRVLLKKSGGYDASAHHPVGGRDPDEKIRTRTEAGVRGDQISARVCGSGAQWSGFLFVRRALQR